MGDRTKEQQGDTKNETPEHAGDREERTNQETRQPDKHTYIKLINTAANERKQMITKKPGKQTDVPLCPEM